MLQLGRITGVPPLAGNPTAGKATYILPSRLLRRFYLQRLVLLDEGDRVLASVERAPDGR